MAASAALTFPLQLTRDGAREDALYILENSAGSQDVTLDAAGNASLKLQFPGNIDSLMGKLRSKKLIAGLPSMGVSLPVKAFRTVDGADVLERLRASATLSNVAYDGSTITATALATTSALRYIFEEIINAGLMPIDFPTEAGSLEFVL